MIIDLTDLRSKAVTYKSDFKRFNLINFKIISQFLLLL